MKKKKHLFTNIIFFLILSIILLSLAYYLYIAYSNIEIDTEYDASKLNTSTNETSSIFYTPSNISDMLENVSNCVVGISKIKSHSNSIFSANTLSDLGIGSGIIISNNGYILSNCHVTGEKLSTCYITLENGYVYDATVLWCNSELDLSISKINASNLNYVKFGDSSQIKPGENVNYEFSNVANNSNVYLDNFKWYDYIPTDYIRLQKMTTGTWNQDLTYKVYYKTNKTDDYVLFKENLSTNENYDLDFTQITLTDDEYITETMFDFGKVEKGFRESTSPTMNCKSFDTLKENDTFTNHTKSIGTYFGVTAEANSKWTTITHIPEEKHEVVLPRTGK